MYLFHHRWRKPDTVDQNTADTAQRTAAPAKVKFEDMQILRDAAPLIGLTPTDLRVLEVLAASACSGSMNGAPVLAARMSLGWLSSAADVEREALSAALGRLAAAALINLPQAGGTQARGRANRQTYDLSPLPKRIPELEWLKEAAERGLEQGEEDMPDYIPDSFRAFFAKDDAGIPALADETKDGGNGPSAALPALLGSWAPAAPASPAVESHSGPARAYARKTKSRRGLMRQSLSSRLAARRVPCAVRGGRCLPPAAASHLRKPLESRAATAPATISLPELLLNGLQSWQKALSIALGIPAAMPAAVPVIVQAKPPAHDYSRRSRHAAFYDDAYWTMTAEDRNRYHP